jgi:ABC-2 type transport system ATP-binding protein
MLAIETNQLAKTYKAKSREIPALKPLDLRVEQGEVFGLLGPNGAGKTTLLKLMLGIIAPTGGSATIFGEKIASIAAKNLIGYLPEAHRFPLHLTGQQMLEFYGNLAGMSGARLQSRIEHLTELVRMKEWRGLRIRQYSKGMMQRIGLAQSLLNEPKLLFLDEPTDGIDPVGRKEIRDVLADVKQDGTTIFVNSHLLSEVELISDRVAILRKGELMRIGSTEELTRDPGVYTVQLDASALAANDAQANGTEASIQAVRQAVAGVQEFNALTGELDVAAATPEALNMAIDALRKQSLFITAITAKKSTLEELFFEIVMQQTEEIKPEK